jgi:cytochrome P450
MRAYFREQVDERRVKPRDDLLSALARAEEQGDRLSADEQFAMCVLILVAGHETTTNLIGNAALALLRNPGERKRLADDPALLPTAVEEFLRYDGVVQLTARVAVTDIAIGDAQIESGDLIVLVLAAANRDPERFESPDRLDVSRSDNPHLGLGHGAHFCLGAGLARAEASIALGSLLRRIPDFDGDTKTPDYKPTALLRGLRSLPITFRQ